MNHLPACIRNPELYEGMSLERVLKEREATLACIQNMRARTSNPDLIEKSDTSIAAVTDEVRALRVAIRLGSR